MPEGNDSSYLQRLAALKLLRENLLLSNPSTYAATDIAEDFPGQIRNVTSILKNVLPSQAIISKDPEKRKKQIIDAVRKIKDSQNSESLVPYKEIVNNATDMALGSVVPSVALSGLIGLLNFRKPWERKGFFRKKLNFRSPIDPIGKIKELKNNKGALSEFLKDIGKDTATNVATAATIAGITPLLSSKLPMSDRALKDAANVMQKFPQLTSLPSSELLSVMDQEGEASKKMNALTGAGLGAGIGILGILPPALIKSVGSSLANKSLASFGRHLVNNLKKDLPVTALAGSAIGGISGYMTDKFDRKNYEKDLYDKV